MSKKTKKEILEKQVVDKSIYIDRWHFDSIPLSKLIEKIQEWIEQSDVNAIFHIEDDYPDGINCYISYTRLETDEEYNKRIKQYGIRKEEEKDRKKKRKKMSVFSMKD